MNISSYYIPIAYACLMFLPVSAMFTLPFMVIQYRRYGTIPFLRVLVVYSFILYMMCAFLLTVLPLPDWDKLMAMSPKSPQLIPFETYANALDKAGFHLLEPGSWVSIGNWKSLLTSHALFEILANIVMQIPLGVFLRYYFRRSWRQTLLIGFLVSLFYELTQLSGLFFIYPKAYRLCSVDDLIDNTLGAMIGYGITPFLCALLPSREELDKISLERGRHITWLRRVTSAILDWILYPVVVILYLIYIPQDSSDTATMLFLSYPIWVLVVCVIQQYFTQGQTLGKKLLKVRLVSYRADGRLTWGQLILRYLCVYFVLPFLCLIVFSVMLIAFALAFFSETAGLRLTGIALAVLVLITGLTILILCLRKYKGEFFSIITLTRIEHETLPEQPQRKHPSSNITRKGTKKKQ